MNTDQLSVETRRDGGGTYTSFWVGPLPTFTDADARQLLRAAAAAASSGSRTMIAFYALGETALEELLRATWHTVSERSFMRPVWLGTPVELRWLVGFDDDEAAFVKVVEWAWNTSTCETLLLLVGRPEDAAVAATVFKDDWGDADTNDVTLLRYFDPVFARTHEGNHLRITSRRLGEDDVRRLFSER